VLTSGGALPARWVVHTVGPVWQGGDAGEPALLRSCYERSLDLAAANGARSIAFPSISTGAFGYPIGLAAPIALRATRNWLRSNPSYEEVRFVLYSDEDLEVYRAAEEALR